MKPISKILVATDFSVGAAAAADYAARLAEQLEAEIDLVTVVDTSPLTECYGDLAFRNQRVHEITHEAQDRLAKFNAAHFSNCERVHLHVRDGNVLAEILGSAVELGSDLIILGTHGRSGLAQLVIGSTADKVVRSATIPVMTVRAPG